jgi:hypothetical protein
MFLAKYGEQTSYITPDVALPGGIAGSQGKIGIKA